MTHRLLLLLAVVMTAACGDNNPGTSALVRDSAGIRIVENTAPQWTSGAEWRLSTEPIVDIGAEGGDPDQQLYRVERAVRLPDGRIVVANVGSQELRFYAEDGAYLTAAGGEGEGPGEFTTLGGVWLVGDTLLALSRNPPHLAVFDLEGRYVRSVRLQPTAGGFYPMALDVFGDGGALVEDELGPVHLSEGPFREDFAFVRYLPTGEPANSLGRYLGPELFVYRRGDRLLPMLQLFGRRTTLQAHGQHLYVASSEAYEVRLYSLDGRLETIVRKRHEPIEVTRADVEFAIARLLGRLPEDAAAEQNALYRRQPVPATMPAFGWNDLTYAPAIHVDDLSDIWVKEYNRPGDTRYRWSVFDAEGRWLGVVEFPGALQPKHIGDDFVLALWQDSLDVEHVQLYELIKPEQ